MERLIPVLRGPVLRTGCFLAVTLPTHLESLARATFEQIQRDHPHAGPPGVQVGVAIAGEQILNCAMGTFDTLTARPLSPHSVFKCASQSKPICAAVAMKLAEQRVLDLDRPVAEVLPWRSTQVQSAGFDASIITPRMLLSHTAGWNIRGFPMIPIAERGPSIIDIISGCFGPELTPTLQFQPGTSTLYAGGNYAVLQAVIEHAAAAPYSTLLDELVIRPAGLTSIWAGWRAGQDPHTVRGHSDGLPLQHTWYPALGSSGLFATAIDLARLWSRIACTNRTAALLSPLSVREMTRVHSEHDGVSFGLGFVLAPWNDLTICKHHGWCTGFFNLTESILQLSAAVTVQSNGEGDAAKLLTESISSKIIGELIARRDQLTQ